MFVSIMYCTCVDTATCIFMCIHMMEISTLYQHSTYINNLIINASIFNSSHPSQSPRSPASSSFASPITLTHVRPHVPAHPPRLQARGNETRIQSIHPVHPSSQPDQKVPQVQPSSPPSSPPSQPVSASGLAVRGIPSFPSLQRTSD
jgi:hypothetical protein